MINEILGWTFTILSILGGILNVYKIKWGFVLWVIANTGWIYINIITGLYVQIPIWITFNIISIAGFWHWNKNGDKPKKPKKQ